MPALAIDITLFIAYIGASSCGLLLLKRSLSHIRLADASILAQSPDTLLLAAGVILYVVSFGLWMCILARLPLSTAYPIAIGLTTACSIGGAVLLLNERFGALKLAGVIMILAGCVALSLNIK